MKAIAIHQCTEFGEKNVAVAIEYDQLVHCALLTPAHFTVSNNRTIQSVYVSSEPKLCSNAHPNAGHYVILELKHDGSEASTLPRQWEVKERLPRKEEILQQKAIRCDDGIELPAWESPLRCQTSINDVADRFTLDEYTDPTSGARIAYSLFIPESFNSGEKYPLVLYFHGGGEKGNNGLKSLLSTLNATVWASESEQIKHPCFVYAPQCPTDGDWIDPDTYETTATFDAVCSLLFKLIEKYPIDRRRIYCTGFSMGGMGSWEATKRYPNLFAATLVFAGQCNYEGLEALKDNNIWVFHGEDDDKAMPGNIDNLESLENAGARINRAVWDGSLRGDAAIALADAQLDKPGNILHTLYQEGSIGGGWAHEFGWRPAITNERVRDWLFSHMNSRFSMAEQACAVEAEFLPRLVNLGFDGGKLRQIAAGNRHNLALIANGTILAWGFNCTGQIGNGIHGAHSDQLEPIVIPGLCDIVQVAAGNDFSLALSADGYVYGWGGNLFGQLGELGAIVLTPTLLAGIEKVKAIDAGDNYAVALKRDGTVLAWGANSNGQLGNGTFRSNPVAEPVLDLENPRGILSDVIQIKAGVRTVAAVKADGTLRCWGDSEYGQVGKGFAMHGPGTTLPFRSLDKTDATGILNRVSSVAVGRCFTAVLTYDGTVRTWGLHRHGELGHGSSPIAVNSNDANPDFINTIVDPLTVQGMKDITKLYAGMNHTVALRSDGTLWSWGGNSLMNSGVLGAGELRGSNHPVRVAVPERVVDVYVGLNHNFAVTQNGAIWAWGNASRGRLGPLSSKKCSCEGTRIKE